MGIGPLLVPKIERNPRQSTPAGASPQRDPATQVPLSLGRNAAPHARARSRRAPRWSPVRVRLAPSKRPLYCALRGVPCASLALWPTIAAEEAVLRQGARSSATRQPTIEANGIDCGVSPLVGGIRVGTARTHTV